MLLSCDNGVKLSGISKILLIGGGSISSANSRLKFGTLSRFLLLFNLGELEVGLEYLSLFVLINLL